MWGDGVPDSHTIPSLVAKELANNPVRSLTIASQIMLKEHTVSTRSSSD